MENLPPEDIFRILISLDPKDLLSLCQTNVTFRTICQDDKTFEYLTRSKYPNAVNRKPWDMTWKKFYLYEAEDYNIVISFLENTPEEATQLITQYLEKRARQKSGNLLSAFKLYKYTQPEDYNVVFEAHSIEEAILSMDEEYDGELIYPYVLNIFQEIRPENEAMQYSVVDLVDSMIQYYESNSDMQIKEYHLAKSRFD